MLRAAAPTRPVSVIVALLSRVVQSRTCSKSATVPAGPSGVSRCVTNSETCLGCAGSALNGSAVTRNDSVGIGHTSANALQ